MDEKLSTAQKRALLDRNISSRTVSRKGLFLARLLQSCDVKAFCWDHENRQLVLEIFFFFFFFFFCSFVFLQSLFSS
jgi:hypothetical protein